MRQRRRLGFFVLAAIIVSGGGLAYQAAGQTATEPAAEQSASDGVRFTLHPIGQSDGGFFEEAIQAGESRQLTVVIGNRDDEPLTLRTYASDAYTLTNGGFGLRDEDAPRSEPTSWLDYQAETYDLAPGETIERTFTVTAPAETPPGQYVTGIALQTAEAMDVPGTAVFRQIIRKVSAVSIIVPGPVTPDAELGEPTLEISSRVILLVVPIANTGNYRLRPAGTLTLRNSGGEVVLTAPIAMRSVYAGHETTIEVAMPPQIAPGEYTVDLDLTDADTGWTASRSDRPVTLALPEEPPEADPVEITQASISPVPAADSGDPLQYADVSVEIVNRAAVVPAARLTLSVFRDGEAVEDFALAQQLALPGGATTVQQRYIPAGGWIPGTYSFSLLLESVDLTSGVEATLARADVTDAIVVTE